MVASKPEIAKGGGQQGKSKDDPMQESNSSMKSLTIFIPLTRLKTNNESISSKQASKQLTQHIVVASPDCCKQLVVILQIYQIHQVAYWDPRPRASPKSLGLQLEPDSNLGVASNKGTPKNQHTPARNDDWKMKCPFRNGPFFARWDVNFQGG